MEILNFTSIESQVLNVFNQGKTTFEEIVDNVSASEKTISTVIESLISKNVLVLNTTTKKYEYQSKIDGEFLILEGNILLPTTIIKTNDCILVSRGKWYEFPVDFDVRRIIWNVTLESKTNSTLVDMIKTSILKEKKSKIVQLPEWENLVNKIVPYNENIGLLIHCVGENVTDVSIVFKIKLVQPGSDITVEHRGFTIRTEIATEELLGEIKKPVAERNYSANIKLNQIYNFSDFLFSKNEIPVSLKDNELVYIKITGIKKSFEFTYYKKTSVGESKKIDTEIFDDNTEAIEKMREIFRGLPNMLLAENNFLVELTE